MSDPAPNTAPPTPNSFDALLAELSATPHSKLVKELASCAALASAYHVELGLDPLPAETAADVPFAVWRALRERVRRVRARDN